jgi:hypothetical protein
MEAWEGGKDGDLQLHLPQKHKATVLDSTLHVG